MPTSKSKRKGKRNLGTGGAYGKGGGYAHTTQGNPYARLAQGNGFWQRMTPTAPEVEWVDWVDVEKMEWDRVAVDGCRGKYRARGIGATLTLLYPDNARAQRGDWGDMYQAGFSYDNSGMTFAFDFPERKPSDMA